MIDRSSFASIFLFRSWRRKLQEARTVDIILSFNDD